MQCHLSRLNKTFGMREGGWWLCYSKMAPCVYCLHCLSPREHKHAGECSSAMHHPTSPQPTICKNMRTYWEQAVRVVAEHVSLLWGQGLGPLIHHLHSAAPGLQSRLQLPAQPCLQRWPLTLACRQ